VQRYLAAGLPADRIEEVPNGVDLARFRPAGSADRAALREQLGFPADCPIVLFVGVVSCDKQPHVLLEAWAAADGATLTQSLLVFVGASDPRLYELGDGLTDQMQRQLRRMEGVDRVRFFPLTTAIETFYRAADVVVLPSVREGLPNVVLEAMASAVPVVASRLPGSTDTMLTDGVDGLLVEPGDVGGFAKAITRLLTNPAEAARMGAAARRTVEQRYSIAVVAERWLRVYDRLLGQRPAVPSA